MKVDPEVLEYIGSDLDDDQFNVAALRLFRRQAKTNSVYRRYLAGVNTVPDHLTHWTQIPALPADSFKDQRVASFPPIERCQTFRTSGTTADKTGTHEFATLEYYEKSLISGFQRFMPPVADHHWVSLIPSFEDRPESSLSYMVSYLEEHVASRSVDYHCDESFNFSSEHLLDHLISLFESDEPVFLLGTSFAHARFAEELRDNIIRTEVPRSFVMFDTGGYKGHHRRYSPNEFLELMGSSLGVEPRQVWNEYGMTELSSQAYARLDEGVHRFPPWTRVILRDPATGTICQTGEQGLIQIVDLANVGSVCAIQTLDIAIQEDVGIGLLGRADRADLRGCSLNYEI
ncbi:MAG: hypothetical protein AAF558_00980 [Verrucomicrobiota bacterium]